MYNVRKQKTEAKSDMLSLAKDIKQMVCLKIKNTREFMQKFLMSETFADFLLAEARIDTHVSYNIDGHVRKEFYSKEERELLKLYEFAAWESVRPQVVQIVKGKRTPLFMKLVLVYVSEKAKDCLEAAASVTDSESFVKYLLCTVKYENGVITLTGGVSYQGFTMDKDPEKRWDQALCRLIDEMGLEYEII